jgi:RimJ/RimL family protein N-acetyltransferase
MVHQHEEIDVSERTISTLRLLLRPWSLSDAESALTIFGNDDVARWLAPAMNRIADVDAMRDLLERWIDDRDDSPRPTGRWAIEEVETGRVVGAGSVLPMPPLGEDLEIAWQLAPDSWGQGFATEAGHALAHYAFSRGEDEVFAVVRPRNTRGLATARRVGLEWVGETDKYYDLQLQVFRLRKGDLDAPLLRRPD